MMHIYLIERKLAETIPISQAIEHYNMNKSPVRIACVGAGYFSVFHLEAWKRLVGVELIAICDSDRGKAEAFAHKFDIPSVYADYKELIEKEKPDVLDIITPPHTHLEICSYTAEKEIHIICQKPLAPTLEESKTLLDKVAQHPIRFMVHENFRFQPWFRAIKREIDAGTLGDILHTIYFRFRTGDGWQADAYMNRQPYFRSMPRLFIYETGVHYIDTFRYLGGDISHIFARLKRWNPDIAGEDAAMVQFEFENGAIGVLDANRFNESEAEDPRFTFGTCVVEGNKGSISLQHDGTLIFKALGETPRIIEYPLSRKNFAGDCVYAAQAHFLDAFRNGTPFEHEGAYYLETLMMQEAVYLSSEERRVVEVKDL